MSVDDSLLPERIRQALLTKTFGRRVYYLAEVDSTNRVAGELAAAGEPHGTMVVSDFQTKGRGRSGRHWISPPRRNLLFSLILRPPFSATALLPVTLAFSASIAETLSAVVGEALAVKWPNDVHSAKGKICGILSESSSTGSDVAYAVIGVGINVNMREEEFSPQLTGGGASCYLLTGREDDRAEVLARVLFGLEATYLDYCRGGFQLFVARYSERLSMAGRQVTVRGRAGNDSGRVVGVQEDGALIVETPKQKRIIVYDGEVTLD